MVSIPKLLGGSRNYQGHIQDTLFQLLESLDEKVSPLLMTDSSYIQNHAFPFDSQRALLSQTASWIGKELFEINAIVEGPNRNTVRAPVGLVAAQTVFGN